MDDIIHSHALLRDKGRPNHRFYYSKVTKVEKIGSDTVKFTFKPEGDREMPLIMGLMPVLPKHVYTSETFEKTTLVAPTGSGPYLVDKIDPGSGISYKRNPNYWGRDLPINKGRYNLDDVSFIFYRDNNVLFEDFKKRHSPRAPGARPQSLGHRLSISGDESWQGDERSAATGYPIGNESTCF